MNIRPARLKDMEAIYGIERQTFPPQEMARPDTYPYRLQHYPDYFFVYEQDNKVVAFLVGRPVKGEGIQDEMYCNEPYPEGQTFALLSVATDPAYQGRGFASQLVEFTIGYVQSLGASNIILACKEEKMSFYEKFGFYKMAVSQSAHGNAVWYDMKINF